MAVVTRYSHQSCRSKPVVLGFSLVIVAESVALHAFLYRRSTMGAIALLIANILTIWWLVRDYQAVGAFSTELADDHLRLRVGRRADCSIALDNIATATRPTWQQVPPEMTKGYLKLTGFDDPNVLITAHEPVVVRLGLGISRKAKTLGLLFDAPEAFLSDLGARRELRGGISGPMSAHAQGASS